MAQSRLPSWLSKRKLEIFVSLWVTREGRVPSSTSFQRSMTLSLLDSIQEISSDRELTRPAASRARAASHCTKRQRIL